MQWLFPYQFSSFLLPPLYSNLPVRHFWIPFFPLPSSILPSIPSTVPSRFSTRWSLPPPHTSCILLRARAGRFSWCRRAAHFSRLVRSCWTVFDTETCSFRFEWCIRKVRFFHHISLYSLDRVPWCHRSTFLRTVGTTGALMNWLRIVSRRDRPWL